MKNIRSVGIDLSKTVFHFIGMNHKGRVIWKTKSPRNKFIMTLVNNVANDCQIYMEATGSAHYWCRELKRHDYCQVKQIQTRFVKPFVKSQKNDYNDAEAICEAGCRPQMRFVEPKSSEQQELEAIHRIRQRRVQQKVKISNQIRGLLAEHGIVIAQGITHLRKFIIKLKTGEEKLSATLEEIILDLGCEYEEVEQAIALCEKQLSVRAKQCAVVRRLMTIPGIGLMCATALVAAHGDPQAFKNGRFFAAWLGLVPRQFSSGGKTRLGGITKRGNKYLRYLLIHGARASMRFEIQKDSKHALWLRNMREKKGANLTAVALANKNARIAWRILTSNDVFNPQLPHVDL